VLPLNFPYPPYTAVIECELTESELVTNVATPDPFNVPVLSVAAPSLNVTVPLGVPVPGLAALIIAVNATACPQTDRFNEEVTTAADADLFTVCVNVGDVLPLNFPYPPYTAVIECELTESELVTNVAAPDPFNVPVPSGTAAFSVWRFQHSLFNPLVEVMQTGQATPQQMIVWIRDKRRDRQPRTPRDRPGSNCLSPRPWMCTRELPPP
jgi:hypothetical protein